MSTPSAPARAGAQSSPAPTPSGWRMPAEWEAHERCLMAWPARAELWGERLGQARRDYAAIARAISVHEPVLMLARAQDIGEARWPLRRGRRDPRLCA